MSRRPNWPPKIIHHRSGQARVTYQGKSYYLGVYGSPESQAAYARLLVELSTGTPALEEMKGVTLSQLLEQYLSWLASQPDTSSKRKLRAVAGAMKRLFLEVPVSSFSVRHLETLRSSWTNGVGCEQQSPSVANTNVSRAREILRWAEIRGLAPEGLYGKLLALPPLKGKAKSVEPVSWSVLQATLPHLEPTPATICMLSWWTAMRPKEVCSLTAESIDLATGWITLTDHKTSAKTGTHVLPIGPQARKILEHQLSIRRTGWLFPGVGDSHYAPLSLARTVARATAKHQIQHWTPYQLRHAAKERIAKELGIEAARVILRHTSLGMTARYASRVDPNFAQEIAKKCG